MKILVVSYGDDARAALAHSVTSHSVAAVACATFLEAEKMALRDRFNGLLIELPSVIKAKGEEKIVAYTLANFFPTLRVRTIGTSLVPMAMPGSARQDKSLADFLTKSCAAFSPRSLRAHRRHPVCLLTQVRHGGEEIRGFTLNLSWGGAFIADVGAERFSPGAEMGIYLPLYDRRITASIRWIMPWGGQSAPGIGVSFLELDETVETAFAGLLRTRKEFDRDRLVA